LSEYSATQDWYLGKPSISSPLEILLDNVSIYSNENN
jgi:fringe